MQGRRLQRGPRRSPPPARWSTPPGGTLGSRRAVWVSRERDRAAPVDPAWDPQGIIVTPSACLPTGRRWPWTLPGTGRRDIWVKQLPSGPFSRITFGDTASVRPVWSPDGRDGLLHHRSGRLRRRPVYAAPGRRDRRRQPGAQRRVARLRPGRAVARRPLAACSGAPRPGPAAPTSSGFSGGRHDTGAPGGLSRRRSCSRHSRPTGTGWRTLERVGDGRGLRPAVPRDRVGQVAGVHRRRHRARSGPRAAASCSTSTARARWCRPRSGRVPPSRWASSGRCSRRPVTRARAGPVLLPSARTTGGS